MRHFSFSDRGPVPRPLSFGAPGGALHFEVKILSSPGKGGVGDRETGASRRQSAGLTTKSPGAEAPGRPRLLPNGDRPAIDTSAVAGGRKGAILCESAKDRHVVFRSLSLRRGAFVRRHLRRRIVRSMCGRC